MRHRFMRLCVRENAFDFEAYHALKTRVTLREAMEIEAVLCVEGDNRHAFQTWYGDVWVPRQAKNPAKPVGDLFDSLAGKHAIDIETVERELEATIAAIADTERLLQEHRLAVVTGGETLEPQVVDVFEGQLRGLEGSQTTLKAQLVEARNELSGESYTDGLATIGPVQSGERKVTHGHGN